MKAMAAKTKVVAVVLLAGVLPWLVSVAALHVFGTVVHKQERLHESLELAGAFIAVTLATLLWFRARYEKGSDHLLWVAAALVEMGLTNGAHALVPFGIAWSWLRHGSTLVGGLLFALVWLPLPGLALQRRKLSLRGWQGSRLRASWLSAGGRSCSPRHLRPRAAPSQRWRRTD